MILSPKPKAELLTIEPSRLGCWGQDFQQRLARVLGDAFSDQPKRAQVLHMPLQ